MMAVKKETEAAETTPKFTKEQLLKSKTIEHSRDIISVLLEEGKMYSLDEVNSMVTKFKQKEVK